MLRSPPVGRTRLARVAVITAICLSTTAFSQLPATAAAADQYQVTITVPARDPLVNVPFSITGAVSPAAAGAAVYLQRQVGATFQTIETDALDASSRYSFTKVLGTVGAYTYRVLKPAGGGVLEGISPVVRIWVTGPTILSGPVMRSGDGIVSTSGGYRLWMRPNGNLELDVTSTGRPLWSSETAGNPGAWAVLLRNADLVVHAADGSVLMHTRSGGHPLGTYSLTIGDDADLNIFNSAGSPVWSSLSYNDRLAANESLQPSQYLSSPNRRFQLIMGTNGDLVLYDTRYQYTKWDSATAVPGSSVTMQSDGNLVLRGPLGKPLWSSGTSGHPGAVAVLQDDGNLVVYDGITPIWATEGISGVLGDDYPSDLRNAAKDTVIDPWRFYNRECVSFVAWRMNHANHVAFSNFMGGGRFGNANTWDDNARKLGYTVDKVPARGAIAQSDSMGSLGHVAWVAHVGVGVVTVEDYNYTDPGMYGFRTVPTATYIYIHIKDL